MLFLMDLAQNWVIQWLGGYKIIFQKTVKATYRSKMVSNKEYNLKSNTLVFIPQFYLLLYSST
jgi:hypothetical protein